MHNPPKAAFSIKDYRFTKVYIDLDKHDPAKTLDINFDTSGKFLYILCNIFKISTIQNPYCF